MSAKAIGIKHMCHHRIQAYYNSKKRHEKLRMRLAKCCSKVYVVKSGAAHAEGATEVKIIDENGEMILLDRQ
jgi:hypothetical protein